MKAGRGEGDSWRAFSRKKAQEHGHHAKKGKKCVCMLLVKERQQNPSPGCYTCLQAGWVCSQTSDEFYGL